MAPSPSWTAAALVPSRPGHCRGPCRAGAPGAVRRRLEEAWRAAARGCAPVCVQSGSAGCAPSRAAMRKQTHGNSSAPLARSPRARRRCCRYRRHSELRSPRARLPGCPAPRPAPLAPPLPRPAPVGAGSLTYRPTRARAHAPGAPRGPPGSWPLESKVRAMRRDQGDFPARHSPGKFLAWLFSAGLGEGPRRQASLAGGRGPLGAEGHKLPNLTLVRAARRGGRRTERDCAAGPALCRLGEGPEELSPPQRGACQPRQRPRHRSSGSRAGGRP